MNLTEKYIISKGFKPTGLFSGNPTWSLWLYDIAYHISYLEWRSDYSVYIEYGDPVIDANVGQRFSIGTLSTEGNLDSLLDIIGYRDFYLEKMKEK